MKGHFYKINTDESLSPVAASSAKLEKIIQSIFEKNLEKLLGIKFLESEYVLESGDRIDTIGIDGNHRPVIIEYKKENKRYASAQIREYIDGLEKVDFSALVGEKLGRHTARNINFSARSIYIGREFSESDKSKAQANKTELIEYGIIDDSILILEQVEGDSGIGKIKKSKLPKPPENIEKKKEKKITLSFDEAFAEAAIWAQNFYERIENFTHSLGQGVTIRDRRKLTREFCLNNTDFANVRVENRRRSGNCVRIWVRLKTNAIEIEPNENFQIHNVEGKGNWGGRGRYNSAIHILNESELGKAILLIEKAYDQAKIRKFK